MPSKKVSALNIESEKMVEISYGEYSEQAELAGKSVAEAREQYKAEFNIPDKAKARLNDKEVKKKLEPKTMLDEGDELSFEEKSRKGLVLLGAFLLALAVTGGIFAYGYTTAGVTLGVIAQPDWATVSVNPGAGAVTWDVFGRAIGKLPDDEGLFDITTDPEWTAWFEVRVYLTNTEELVKGYRYLNMKLALFDLAGAVADEQGLDGPPDWQILNLRNAEVTFFVEHISGAGSPYTVQLVGGNFMAHPGAWFDTDEVNPELWIEVTQAGVD